LGVGAAGCVALAVHWEVWASPKQYTGGVVLLVLMGVSLGAFAKLYRPDWRVRAGGVVALVCTALTLNLVWFAGLDAGNKNFSLTRQTDSSLPRRYTDHHHWIPRQKAAHFVMADFLKGKPVHYVKGNLLRPRFLLALIGVSELVELSEPDYPLPAPAALTAAYSVRILQGYSPNLKGEERFYRIVGITQGAENAAYFVVLAIRGTDFIIPDPVWRTIRMRQILKAP